MTSDEQYLNIILDRIRVCKTYKPKFGLGGSGLRLDEFSELYGSDVFYTWFGLDNPLMYAAHRAAGGITSIYRQIGIGCEALFRRILMDQFDLTSAQSKWSYEVKRPDGTSRKLSLDGRLELGDIASNQQRDRLTTWLRNTATVLGVAPEVAIVLKGMVFEVRQGYKSKDAKRQNADIANAATAYSQGYLPIGIILSAQMDSDIMYRYQAQRWLILLGQPSGSATASTYVFMKREFGITNL